MEAFLQPFFPDLPNVRNKYLKSGQRGHSVIRCCEKEDNVIENNNETEHFEGKEV